MLALLALTLLYRWATSIPRDIVAGLLGLVALLVLLRRLLRRGLRRLRVGLTLWRRFGRRGGRIVKLALRDWPEVAERSGLTRRARDQHGASVREVPLVRHVDLNNGNAVLEVEPVGGSIAEYSARAAALAGAFGAVRVSIEPGRSPGMVRLTVVDADPLSDTRVSTNPYVVGDGVRVALGVFEDGSPWEHDWVDASHVALQGATRSGKSVITYSLLGGVAGRDDVIVTGVDPTGVLFRPWLNHPASDLRVSGTRDMSAAAAVLHRLTEIVDARIAALGDRDKVEAFSAEEPLLLVVLEEYPGVLAASMAEDAGQARKPAERVQPRIKRSVQRLVQEGAKVGVRVLILAQRMDAEIIGGAERSNLGTRVSMRVDAPEAVRMLHPQAPQDVPERMTYASPGVAYVDVPGRGGRWTKANLMEYGDYLAVVRGENKNVVPS
ncbi:hypothetical protein GCM10009718_29880 [Isoptericola halotolerans]